MLVSSEVAKRHARRIIMMHAQHPSISYRQPAVPDQSDEPGSPTDIPVAFSAALCFTGHCDFENRLNKFPERILNARNYESMSDESESNLAYQERAVKKPTKHNAQRPLHHVVKVLKPIAHKPVKLLKPYSHKPTQRIVPMHPTFPAPIKTLIATPTKQPMAISGKPAQVPTKLPAHIDPASVTPKAAAAVDESHIKPVAALPVRSSAQDSPVPQPPHIAAPPVHASTKTPPAPATSAHVVKIGEKHILNHHSDKPPASPQQKLKSASIAGAAAVLPNLKKIESSPAKASTPSAAIIPPNQAPQSETTPLPVVEAEVPQFSPQSETPETQPIATSEAQDLTGLPANSPPSQDSSSPNPLSSSIAADAPQDSDQGVNSASSFISDGNATIDPATTALNIQSVNPSTPEQSIPIINGTQDPVTSATPLNNSMLNNDTMFNNTAMVNNLHGFKLGDTPPNVFAAGPSSHTSAAVGGVFGSLALIALVFGFFVLAHRRRTQKPESDFGTYTDAPSNGSAPEMAQVHSGTSLGGLPGTLDSTMSPVDPVTRFSLGGATLLKRLEGLTEAFNTSDNLASPTESSSDNEPDEMVLTPTDDEFNTNPLSIGQPKTDSVGNPMTLAGPAMLSPSGSESEGSRRLLMRSDSADTVDNLNRESGGTTTSYGGGVSSGYQETVKFEDSSDDGNGDAAKTGIEQPWWGAEHNQGN
ncbi:hypothetical protein PtB15_3B649 [Puccinia triticina]|nr:hypothetical protein PtB15_3B649 [Puccinia triticina]